MRAGHYRILKIDCTDANNLVPYYTIITLSSVDLQCLRSIRVVSSRYHLAMHLLIVNVKKIEAWVRHVGLPEGKPQRTHVRHFSQMNLIQILYTRS